VKIPIKLDNGIFKPLKPEQVGKLVNGAVYTLDILKHRTSQQNKALHKYFSLLAYELNSIGAYCNIGILEGHTQWNELLIKELVWRPIQKIIVGKNSTAELSVEEINKIYEKVSEVIFDRYNFTLPFPKE